MAIRDEVALLKRIALFSHVSAEHLNVLVFASEEETLASGKVLFKQGDEATAAYLVLKGKVSLLGGKGRAQKEVGTAAKGSFLGEQALLCEKPYAVTAKAAKKLKVLQISRHIFFRSVSEFPEMGVQMMRALSLRLDETLTDFGALRATFDTGADLTPFRTQEPR